MATLKQKLLEHRPLRGTHVRLNDSAITELISNLGFDFIWVDTEHSSIDYGTLQNHLIAARAGGTPAIVRIPWNDQVMTKRVLDMGADGIVFPMVNTAAQAQQAMDGCIYPPDGKRGAGPTRLSMYGLYSLQECIQKHWDICRFIQIESKEAVDNIEEIVQVPNLDGIILGPCDLSGSIGRLGDIYCEENLRLLDRAISVATAANIPVGISLDSNDPDELRFWVKRGVSILSSGMDFLAILKTAVVTKKNIEAAFAPYFDKTDTPAVSKEE